MNSSIDQAIESNIENGIGVEDKFLDIKYLFNATAKVFAALYNIWI